jgi:hypothetical protein
MADSPTLQEIEQTLLSKIRQLIDALMATAARCHQCRNYTALLASRQNFYIIEIAQLEQWSLHQPQEHINLDLIAWLLVS